MEYFFPVANQNKDLVDILQKINYSLEQIHEDRVEMITTLRSIDNHIQEKTKRTEKALSAIEKKVSDLAFSFRLAMHH